MGAFVERITGGQVGGTTERSIRLSLSFIRLGPVIILLLLVRAAKGESVDPMINTGITLVTEENAPRYLEIREEQLGALLGVGE